MHETNEAVFSKIRGSNHSMNHGRVVVSCETGKHSVKSLIPGSTVDDDEHEGCFIDKRGQKLK